MKNLALLFVLIGTAGIFSCDKSDEAAVVVDVTIDLNLETPDGKDLLNPTTLNAIEDDEITVVYEIDGEQKSYSECNSGVILDHPEGFFIYPPEAGATKYTLRVFSNDTEGEAITTIKIEGREEIELVTKVEMTNGNILINEIRYKGNLVWSRNSSGPKHLTIVMD